MDQDWITAFEALRKVYSEGAYSNMALKEAISRHKGCRDSFVRNMVKGTLRDTILIDHYIDRLASSGISSIRPRTLILIRMGIHAIMSMDSVPEHAAVNECVALARRVARGQDGFINAMLRSFIRRYGELSAEELPAAVRYSFPEDIEKLIRSQYGDETDDILKGLDSEPPLVIRPNTLRITRDEVASMLRELGASVTCPEETGLALIAEGSGIADSDLWRQGLYTVQSLSSILAVEALRPVPGSKVLDMCSSPGGKTTMMAELMEDRGSITACDIHAHRLSLVRSNAERLGINIIDTELLDGTVTDDSKLDQFDYVLADVPCSGLGVMGGKPEIRFRADTSVYADLAETQYRILSNAVRYAKPGGLIEYSTCTLNKDENERVIESALQTYSLLGNVEMKTYLPYNHLVGFFYCILRKNA